jgi:hypothetical protein
LNKPKSAGKRFVDMRNSVFVILPSFTAFRKKDASDPDIFEPLKLKIMATKHQVHCIDKRGNRGRIAREDQNDLLHARRAGW